MTLIFGYHTHAVRILYSFYLLVGFMDDLPLVLRDLHVVHTDRDGCKCRIFISHRLDVVQHQNGAGIFVCSEALVDDLTELLLSADEVDLQSVLVFCSVNKSEILRDALIVYETSDSRFDQMSFRIAMIVHSHLYLCVSTYDMVLICDQHLVHICEHLSVALFRDTDISVFSVLLSLSLIVELVRTVFDVSVFVVACSRVCQVVRAEDHVLCRCGDR